MGNDAGPKNEMESVVAAVMTSTPPSDLDLPAPPQPDDAGMPYCPRAPLFPVLLAHLCVALECRPSSPAMSQKQPRVRVP